VVAIIYCNERAEVPWERMPKRGKAGQSTSECSQEPDMCGTEGLASARRLRPHGMPMPYFRWTRLGHARNRTKREKQEQEEYLILWLRSPIYYRGLYIVIDKQ